MGELAFVAVFVLATVALLVATPVQFLVRNFEPRERAILKGFSPEARRLYLEKFFNEKLDVNAASSRFEEIYKERFGRIGFVPPGLLLIFVACVASWLCAMAIFSAFAENGDSYSLPVRAVYAFAGAYMWCVIDAISRFRRQDFLPADLYWFSLRLTISPAIGYAVASVFDNALGEFIAFALGAFPLEAILRMVRRLAATKLELDMPGESGGPLSRLDGVDRDIADRLSEQGITTITQIAYCDPIQLTMRSSLSFNFVIDMMNQALAAMYLDGHLEKLRIRGLRGAYEIKVLVHGIENGGKDHLADFSALVRSAATAIGIEENDLKNTFEQIAYDPYTEFLYAIWDEPED